MELTLSFSFIAFCPLCELLAKSKPISVNSNCELPFEEEAFEGERTFG